MPKTLLLADDSVVIQKLVALSFANEDIELVTVYNGDDAIAKVRETRPDLVLTDVVMPGKSGYEVCEAVKRDPGLAHVPVLLLTGTFETFDEERAARVGADGHITKPFEAQALVNRVNQLLAAPPAPRAKAPAPPAAAPGAAPIATPAPPAAPVAPPARSASAAVTSSGEVFDFFDDELDSSLESEGDDGVLAFGDEVEIGSHAAPDSMARMDDALTSSRDPFEDRSDPLSLAEGPASDRTVAIMPEEPAFGGGDPPSPVVSPVEDQPTITASRLFAGAAPPEAPRPPTPPPVAPSRPPDESFEPVVAEGQNANPDPMATVLSEESGFGSGLSIDVGASEDLFADPGESLSPAPTTVAELEDDGPPEPARDSDFEFGFVTPPPTSFEPPPDLEAFPPSTPTAEGPDLMERAELDPAGSSAFDVSSSDLGDPFRAAPVAPPAPPATRREPEPDFETFSSTRAPEPAITAPEAVTPFEAEPPEAEMPEVAGPERDAPPVSPAPAVSNLSEVMQGRIHETLEKVAWEAFADLSDSIVRQVLERVERIAWEVIPQMAETLVREEIRKLKGESED